MHVVVVVLGDVGRSPRMQYHCQSLLDCGHNVTLVGCTGEDLIPTLADEAQKDASRSRLRVVRFKVLDLSALRLFGPLYFALRTIALSFSLLSSLMVEIPNSNYVDFVLVQNPPALPLLLIALCYCQLRAFRQRRRPGMIIDWHNLGFSMLPKGSVTRRLAEAYERFWAPMADGHLTVTKAMEDFLKKDMKIIKNVDVLYDQPPLFFQALDANKQHEILTKLSSVLFQTCPASWIGNLGPNQTLFTEIVDGQARHRPGRPALVTSSTSWTPDEDFGTLLNALVALDQRIQAAPNNDLRILVLVTGKGPERAMYEEKISRLRMEYIALTTVWLDAADYPALLACADVGVSLHTSTSGLDLPMKILDLFGCEIPVIAHDFACLSELVQDGINGRVFRTSQELADSLYELLTPLPQSSSESMSNHAFGDLKTYSQKLQGGRRWHENWMDHAFPVLIKSSPMM